ncbi:TadE/TadG family type IV pilus assembly protein [Aurantiacibacter aquimixticola]|uniref:Pilus assembly protein n=1 Tax=Aurantiacibacter aquimixticola TaxID=1958945 RepID=A0A419RRV4_9SPHN|nr:TadE/TadG family type IV pilus assembly protein [Aurantiacibacter aquimixticola]RJY08533.1 pilus assembly protein [Aurantiacibacter aquimixticola]
MTAFKEKFVAMLEDETGATAVEFAMVLIPFLTIVIAGMDVAHHAFMRTQLQGALADAARRASVEDPEFIAAGDTLEDRIKNAVKDQVNIVAPKATYDIEISNFYDFSGIRNPEKLMRDNNENGVFDSWDNDCFQDLNENGQHDSDTGRAGVGGASDVAFYQVTVTVPRLFPAHAYVGVSPKITMQAEIAVRNQPYDNQREPPVVCGE